MADLATRPALDRTDLTSGLLGGASILKRPLTSTLDTHDLLEAGLPSRALDHLVSHVSLFKRPSSLDLALGISGRTYFRRKKQVSPKPLSREQSGRVWKFAEILSRAMVLMGSQQAAEDWLETPAMGLDRRRPIDLFSTPAGLELVEDYLTRIEFGIYT